MPHLSVPPHAAARPNLRGWLLALTAFALLAIAARAGQYQSFNVAVYVRAYEVRKMQDPEWLRTNWGVIEKQLKVDKVYLEPHRDLILVDDATLQKAKAFFAAKGIQTAAGIAFVRNEGNLFETFCYSQPEQRAKVKEIVEACARNFDEIILDDFFFTSCKCAECAKAKGNRSWTEYRLALMTEVSQHLILDAARAVNPRIRITVKYPNWYEHFQAMGYNLEVQPKMFDRIYTGTETRDSVYNHQHLQPYQSYQQVRYFENIKPGGNGGGWVDTANRIVADRYAEQLWLTMFAKAPEIMLFAMHELLEPLPDTDRAPWQGQGTSFDYAAAARPVAGMQHSTMARVASQALEQIDPIVHQLGRPIGIVSYKPYHSSGPEDFLHNYLGGIGLPIDLRPEFPTDAPLVLLTECAAADPDIVGKIQRQLLVGRDVVITSGLLSGIQDRGFRRDIADVYVSDHKAITREFWGRGIAHQQLATNILLPELRYATNDSWELIATMTNGLGYPVVHYVPFNGARLYILTMPENFGDLYEFPAPVLDQIRRLASKGLWARLEGPGRIALLEYDNHAVIVESFRDEPSPVRIVTSAGITRLRNLLSGEELTGTTEGDHVVFSTTVKPHSYLCFAGQ